MRLIASSIYPEAIFNANLFASHALSRRHYFRCVELQIEMIAFLICRRAFLCIFIHEQTYTVEVLNLDRQLFCFWQETVTLNEGTGAHIKTDDHGR